MTGKVCRLGLEAGGKDRKKTRNRRQVSDGAVGGEHITLLDKKKRRCDHVKRCPVQIA